MKIIEQWKTKNSGWKQINRTKLAEVKKMETSRRPKIVNLLHNLVSQKSIPLTARL